MRLLQLSDDGQTFSLVQFFDQDVPPYAILSHTWGDEEVTYQDIISGAGPAKTGYDKLIFCAAQAAKDDIQLFWVDTCCINKESSAELSEAITSMFRWYRNSFRCYVLLTDVQTHCLNGSFDGLNGHNGLNGNLSSCFRASRWFTRGWTLQELIASPIVIFFSKEGDCLGNKSSLEEQIVDVTHLPRAVVRGERLENFDTEERISWINGRQTTREEDMAYSLLGILGISMLPNYGEGKISAFRRLRREYRDRFDNPDAQERVREGEAQREAMTESLYFDQVELRRMAITNAHFDTCTWLLEHPQYLHWLDNAKFREHHGFLWIKGKPGAGKSTLMKFALAQAQQTTAHDAVISFFFNARGTNLEKATLGAYRSLLYQLFNRFPALQRAFDCLNVSNSSRSSYVWTAESLKTVLKHAVLLLNDSPAVCYIDALDECDEEQVRDLVRFFEHVGDRAMLAGVNFRICFSSRHYPHITLRHANNLILEGQQGHSRDISAYLKSELAIGQTVAQEISAEIQRKACGVFMWVVLVVRILNREYDRGRIHALRRKLHEIPADLHDLFHDILLRDQHDQDESIFCIQWVLFAHRPLSPVELYLAVLYGVEPDSTSIWNEQDIDRDSVERFILDSSRGLTEIVGSGSPNQRVQFIHGAVRDFLLKGDGLTKIWPDFQHNFIGKSHDRLKNCCINYLHAVDINSSTMAGLVASIATIEDFPLVKYATEAFLYHAEVAEANGIPQRETMNSFSLSQWVKLNNILKRSPEYTQNVSLLYVLAQYNFINLLSLQPTIALGLREENEICGCALFAAAANRQREAVEAILAGVVATESHYSMSAKQEFALSGHRLIGGFAADFKYSRKRGILSYVAELGVTPLVDFLVHHHTVETPEVDLSDETGRTPLWLASRAGHTDTVQLLLNTKRVDVNKQDQDGETPLCVAAAKGYHRVVGELLGSGADPNIMGGFRNALLAVCAAYDPRREEMLQTLLMLLSIDEIDMNVRAKDGMTPLSRAASDGQFILVERLLDKGVNIDSQDWSGNTPLVNAIRTSHDSVASLLLERGADINLQGGFHGNALQEAVLLDYDRAARLRIVQLMLDKGANVNAKGGYYGTALQAAAHRGDLEVVKSLLDHGADVNAQVGLYCTALQAAAHKGFYNIASVLIEKGADVNAEGGAYGNALNAAHRYGSVVNSDGIMELLLQHGAKQQSSRKRPRDSDSTAQYGTPDDGCSTDMHGKECNATQSASNAHDTVTDQAEEVHYEGIE